MCTISLNEGFALIQVTGQCDDGSDESIVSIVPPKTSRKAYIDGIGKKNKIRVINLSTTLKICEKAQKSTLSRSWTCPCTVLILSSGRLALNNINLLVSGDLFIGLPILRHLKINTMTLLEPKVTELDGTECRE